MAAELQEGLDDTDVALVDGHVEWRLSPSVPGVEVCPTVPQQLNYLLLVPETGMVDRPVSVFVLQERWRESSDTLKSEMATK